MNKTYEVYIIEKIRRLVATFEDIQDARDYVDFATNKYGNEYIIIRGIRR